MSVIKHSICGGRATSYISRCASVTRGCKGGVISLDRYNAIKLVSRR